MASAPQAFQDVEAVEPRQAEVEEGKVVQAVRERELGFEAVAHPVHRVAAILQPRHDRAADHRVVLDHQHAHACSNLLARNPATVRHAGLSAT